MQLDRNRATWLIPIATAVATWKLGANATGITMLLTGLLLTTSISIGRRCERDIQERTAAATAARRLKVWQRLLAATTISTIALIVQLIW